MSAFQSPVIIAPTSYTNCDSIREIDGSLRPNGSSSPRNAATVKAKSWAGAQLRYQVLPKLLAMFVVGVPLVGNANEENLERKALAILSRSCAECHQPESASFSGIEIVGDVGQLIENQLIVPGDAESSLLLSTIVKSEMPPALAPAHITEPTNDEIETIRQWINRLDEGTDGTSAAFIEASPSDRQVVERAPRFLNDQVLTSRIEAFLYTKPLGKQRTFRFVHFRNVVRRANNNGEMSQAVMTQTAQLALVKALNSLSWSSEGAVIEIVPATDGLVLAIDLASLQSRSGEVWSENKEWRAILELYPYGYEVDSPSFRRIQDITQSGMPIVRGDWLITTALQPPLYHDLLQIPENVKELETFLGLDVELNIAQGKVARAGFNKSKVSPHANRLIERHKIRDGYYWKSYDFLDTNDPKNAKSNIIRFPLGPVFANNPFPDLAFVHDGGEIIFSLPNGLQGYMLVDNGGKRIDAGPEKLVFDFNRVSGTPLIVNGLSCIACHSQGTIGAPSDEILLNAQVGGEVRDRIEKIYRTDVDDLLKSDGEFFRASLNKILLPWQRSAKDESSMRSDGKEPVGLVAKRFRTLALGLSEVAAELGVEDETLESAVRYNPRIQELGLKGLVQGGVINRDEWQKPINLRTAFQRVALELDLGTPWIQPKNKQP